MSRRVFAEAADDEFYVALEKGRSEHLDLGQVLSILVHLYATTDMKLEEHRDFAVELRDKGRYGTDRG
jgi:hypothetical protein